ncbi:MAG: hypothetical protein LBV12_04160 [Puniceicoccales bacterium]|jgi:hypothetical protein|nr:hypothetical protein [Puniceicoccales bacterium]
MELHHTLTQASSELPTLDSSPAKIHVSSIKRWTSKKTENGITDSESRNGAVIRVTGEIDENGLKAKKTWDFEWPDKDLKKLEDSLTLISRHIDSPRRKNYSLEGLRNDAYIDIYNWLRIGWIDNNKTNFAAYIIFFKDGRNMKAEFRGYSHLCTFREYIYRALSL